ncbi:hypothetical protein Hte_010122 [Hypoxylon texense]
MSQSQGTTSATQKPTHDKLIIDAYRWFSSRLLSDRTDIEAGVQAGQISQDQFQDLLHNATQNAETNFRKLEARINAQFGRAGTVQRTVEQGLDDPAILEDGDDGDDGSNGHFTRLWRLARREPGPVPNVGRSPAELRTMPIEILLIILKNLDKADQLRLAWAYPERFLQPLEVEDGLNIIRDDANRHARGEMAEGELPFIAWTMAHGYKASEIEYILDTYDKMFGDKNEVKYTNYMECAVIFRRPDLMPFVVDKGYNISHETIAQATKAAFASVKLAAKRVAAPLTYSTAFQHDILQSKVCLSLCLTLEIDRCPDPYAMLALLDNLFEDRLVTEFLPSFTSAILAVMRRDPTDETRQRLEQALPQMVIYLARHHVGRPSFLNNYPPGSYQDGDQKDQSNHIYRAIDYLVVTFRVPITLEIILSVALGAAATDEQPAIFPNAITANVLTQAVTKRDNNTYMIYRVAEEMAAIPGALNLLQTSFLPFWNQHAEEEAIWHRLFYAALRARNLPLFEFIATQEVYPPRQAIFLAIYHNDMPLLHRLGAMIRRKRNVDQPPNYLDMETGLLSDPRTYDYFDTFAIRHTPLDVAILYRNYPALLTILEGVLVGNPLASTNPTHSGQLLTELQATAVHSTPAAWIQWVESQPAPGAIPEPRRVAIIKPFDIPSLLEAAKRLWPTPQHAQLHLDLAAFFASEPPSSDEEAAETAET